MGKRDWELRDAAAKSTFFFNPCGGVHNKNCPQGSALCQINEKNIAVSFGRADNLTWAEAENGVELTYANGEKCPSDVPRKTLVQLSCNKPTKDKESHRTVINDLTIEDCMITIKVSSPYGCPIEELCSVYDEKECEASEGLCGWKHDACTHTSTSCVRFGRHHISLLAFLGIVVATALTTLFTCMVCLCACCRRRRRRCQRQNGILPSTNKKCCKSKKSEKVVEPEEQSVPEPQFIYQPLQQYPGQQYAQLNPYGFQTKEGVAYPMVQFVPTTSIQNE
jgi:hypothetical protein